MRRGSSILSSGSNSYRNVLRASTAFRTSTEEGTADRSESNGSFRGSTRRLRGSSAARKVHPAALGGDETDGSLSTARTPTAADGPVAGSVLGMSFANCASADARTPIRPPACNARSTAAASSTAIAGSPAARSFGEASALRNGAPATPFAPPPVETPGCSGGSDGVALAQHDGSHAPPHSDSSSGVGVGFASACQAGSIARKATCPASPAAPHGFSPGGSRPDSTRFGRLPASPAAPHGLSPGGGRAGAGGGSAGRPGDNAAEASRLETKLDFSSTVPGALLERRYREVTFAQRLATHRLGLGVTSVVLFAVGIVDVYRVLSTLRSADCAPYCLPVARLQLVLPELLVSLACASILGLTLGSRRLIQASFYLVGGGYVLVGCAISLASASFDTRFAIRISTSLMVLFYSIIGNISGLPFVHMCAVCALTFLTYGARVAAAYGMAGSQHRSLWRTLTSAPAADGGVPFSEADAIFYLVAVRRLLLELDHCRSIIT